MSDELVDSAEEAGESPTPGWLGMSPKMGALVIGGIAIAGIVVMCLTVLLLVLLGDS